MQMKVLGLKELDRKLARLEGKAAKKIVRKAVRSGAKLIHAEAKRLVPVDEGEIKTSIKVRAGKSKRGRKEININVIAGTDHAGAVEFGTDVMEAQPFMRPAADNKGRAAVAVIATEIGRGIEALAKKGR